LYENHEAIASSIAPDTKLSAMMAYLFLKWGIETFSVAQGADRMPDEVAANGGRRKDRHALNEEVEHVAAFERKILDANEH
jgi:hypothetical protein